MSNNTNNKSQATIARMKEMMGYGLKTESKRPYNAVEYERLAADGKKYAIIREGSKFHIKVSDKKTPLKEDYQYIGGFQNHTDYMYDSYANALKHFDMKMSSINEAFNKKGSVDSWNVNGRDTILAEASDKMKLEIARQREIMKNTSIIAEGKSGVCKDCKCELEKTNMKKEKPQVGDATKQGGDFYTKKPQGSDMEGIDGQDSNNIGKAQKPILGEDEEMDVPMNEDTIEGGDSADMNDVSEISEEIDDVGVDDEEVDTEDEGDEDIDIDMGTEDEDVDIDVEEDDELEEFPEEDEEEFEDDIEDEDDDEVASLKAEIESLRSTIDAIADKLGVSSFDTDEPLYPDDEEETEYELEMDDDDDFDDEEVEGDTEIDFDNEGDEEIEDDVTVYESRNYRQLVEGKKWNAAKKFGKKVYDKVKEKLDDSNWATEHTPSPMASDEDWEEFEKMKAARKAKKDSMEETVLHDFGKHPRFKKEPMTYPNPTMPNTEGQWEAGDENSPSKGKKPYASTIGNPKPYGEGPKPTKTANSIAESIVKKILKNF